MDSVPPAPTAAPTTAIACKNNFQRHEISGEYKRSNSDPTRYTYSVDEFNALLAETGIASLCVPPEAGAPFLVNDWSINTLPTVKGRMLVVGFDLWPEAQLVYATWDFSAPTEYEIFATSKDYEALKNASQASFQRILVSNVCMGTCNVYKEYVYPFEDHHIALVLKLGFYEFGAPLDAQVAKFNAGEFPTEIQPLVQRMDALAASLQMK